MISKDSTRHNAAWCRPGPLLEGSRLPQTEGHPRCVCRDSDDHRRCEKGAGDLASHEACLVKCMGRVVTKRMIEI